MIYATCVIYLRRQNDGLGLGEGVRGGACCERRTARRGSPACGALIVTVAYRLQKLAQKGDKVGACLTDVRIGR